MSGKKTSFEILKIKELSYNYKTLETKDIESFNKENLYIGFKLAFEKATGNIFIVRITATYEYKKDDSINIEVLSIECEFRFEIGDLSEVLILHDTDFELPSSIMETMVGISVSTIRGMIAVKTAGTFLSDFPLPLIDATKILDRVKSKKTIKPKISRKKKSIIAEKKTVKRSIPKNISE